MSKKNYTSLSEKYEFFYYCIICRRFMNNDALNFGHGCLSWGIYTLIKTYTHYGDTLSTHFRLDLLEK